MSVRIGLVIFVSVGLLMAIVDHLASPSTKGAGLPSEFGNACAPCGAPCK